MIDVSALLSILALVVSIASFWGTYQMTIKQMRSSTFSEIMSSKWKSLYCLSYYIMILKQ
jgi:hypothetical protein